MSLPARPARSRTNHGHNSDPNPAAALPVLRQGELALSTRPRHLGDASRVHALRRPRPALYSERSGSARRLVRARGEFEAMTPTITRGEKRMRNRLDPRICNITLAANAVDRDR